MLHLNGREVINRKIGEVDHSADDYTLLGYSNSQYQHIHMPAKCYPSLDAGQVVASDANAWTLGAITEVIPAGEMTKAFDVHYIMVEAATSNEVYEIALLGGAEGSEVEIGRVRTFKATNQTGANAVQIQIPVQHVGERISAQLASETGDESLTISLFLHEYE